MRNKSFRTLAPLLILAVLLTALTTAALAAPSESVDIADGSITIGSGTYTQGNNEDVPIPESGLVITGTSEENTITVDPGEGNTAAFTIDGLTLSTTAGASLIDVQSGSAEITLAGTNVLTGSGGTDAGALIRVSDGQELTIKGEGSLTLNNGTENTAAHGAAIGGSAGEDGGTINIVSGDITIVQYGPGAGIGGGGPATGSSVTGDSGDISIRGGNIDITVTAVDSNGGGCGIGPGMNYYTTPQPGQDGLLDSITISGGTVEVCTRSTPYIDYSHGYPQIGTYDAGAAIGTGRIGAVEGTAGGKIHITGTADVTASADAGAAIGGSSVPVTSGSSEEEYIPEGKVTILIDGDSIVKADTLASEVIALYGTYGGAAIGKAFLDWLDYEIIIDGHAQIVAQGGVSGAGIGGSRGYSVDSSLKISIGGSAEVYASSLQDGAGIGSSTNQSNTINSNVEIIIKDKANVYALGGYFAAGIGGGYGNDAGNITIRDEAEVTAVGGMGYAFSSYSIGSGAGIGAGAEGAVRDYVSGGGKVAGTITITPGTTVYAYAEGDKFAIDMDTTSTGAVKVSDTVLNGRFATDANPPVDDDDEPSTIYLLKDGEIDSTLTLPDDYRSFAVTASDGEGVIKVQNAADTSQYAYYEENGVKSVVYALYDTLDDSGNYEMLTKDNLNWVSSVMITPADITIYMGGDGGYDAVVGTDGEMTSSNSMPKPLFYVELPDGLDAEEITLKGNDSRAWEFELAGQDSSGVSLYYINSTGFEEQDHVRVQYSRGDNVYIEDEFDPAAVSELYAEYDISIYSGGVTSIWAVTADGDEYSVGTGTGTLRVRAVEETGSNPVVALSEEPTEPLAPGEAAVTAPEGTTYTLNDTTVPVDEAGVGLLFDSIIDTDADRTGALLAALEGEYNIDISSVNYQAQYLDLVDANNGNAWVKASGNVTVYWGYPEGTDSSDSFTLYHFTDLHRDGSNSGFDIADIGSSSIEVVEITKTAYGISFEVEPGGFSPFVLVWETADEPDEPDEPVIPPYVPPEEPSEPDYTPNWLNTTDHFGYIIGYEDGTVRPNASITRAEVATIFFRLLTDEARESFWRDTNDYSDVAEGSWYNVAVSTLSGMGILGGYEDGAFRPNAPITRAEFAKIAVSFFEYADIEAENIFIDVAAGSWYENYVAVAAELGLIEGYGGGVFRPDATITRAEACAIINRTLGRAPDAEHLLPEDEMNTWPDNADTGVWYYAHIQEATNSHEYRWTGDVEQWTEKLPEPDWDALQR